MECISHMFVHLIHIIMHTLLEHTILNFQNLNKINNSESQYNRVTCNEQICVRTTVSTSIQKCVQSIKVQCRTRLLHYGRTTRNISKLVQDGLYTVFVRKRWRVYVCDTVGKLSTCICQESLHAVSFAILRPATIYNWVSTSCWVNKERLSFENCQTIPSLGIKTRAFYL